MKPSVINCYDKAIPVYCLDDSVNLTALERKILEFRYDFMFRSKWRRIVSIELIREVAIFKYTDGTKLYLEVA